MSPEVFNGSGTQKIKASPDLSHSQQSPSTQQVRNSPGVTPDLHGPGERGGEDATQGAPAGHSRCCCCVSGGTQAPHPHEQTRESEGDVDNTLS